MTNYHQYHLNPINKSIHFACIPLIVLTTINFTSIINIPIPFIKKSIQLKNLLLLIYNFYYVRISWKVYFVMMCYFKTLIYISQQWKKRDQKWFSNSVKIFTLSWVLQFLGHYIEGNRPRLMDSITSAFFEAPLFSLNYVIPMLTNK